MKKMLKYLGIFILIILGIFVALFSLLVFLAVIAPKDQSAENGSVSLNIEYNGEGKIPEEPDPIYVDTMEDALTINPDYYFGDDTYANKVNRVIKVFENDNYTTMFYISVENLKAEAFVGAKFKVRTVNEKKQYALIHAIRSEHEGESRIKPLKMLHLEAPAYDYLSDFGITEGNRFIFGTLGTEKVKTLKIEGQSPTEVIEYTLLGEKEYFWYYENLISDKPSAEFDIEMDEE